MGCTQSRIETEEAVIRCKERKQFMREAVSKRNAFAAAHVAYSVSLKSTGGALTDYAQCQVQDPRPHQPVIQPPMETLPPPPPLPDFNPPAPLLRAATMPEFSIPRVDPKPADPIQEEDEAEVEEEINLIRRGSRSAARTSETAVPPRPRSPPPPPRSPPRAPPPDNSVPAPQESENSTWDYFFSVEIPAPSLSEVEEISPEKKEGDGDGHDNRSSKKENVVADGDTESKVEPQTPEKVIETPVKPEKQQKQVVRSHAASSEAKKVSKVPNMNLFQILSKIDDHFLKASESAREVSTMLEANRFHYHSNFADNRGHIDHSKRVMRAITWNRSFKGLANADDEKDELDFDDNETHASVLDKLLAWEKKLYDEVKAGELMKLDYRKKVALLNKQKKRGTNPETLEKAKAAVSHLHTRYIVDMQSLDSTDAEIKRLRDEQLYPKLVTLVDGMAKMWELMHVHHRTQMEIAVDLKNLDISQAPKETSIQHSECIKQLWNVVQEWNTQLQKLMANQKDYIRALNNWLKLNLIPIESSLKEKVSSPLKVSRPPIHHLLQAWNEHLEKVTDGVARSAITAFAAGIETIILQQDEEIKLKDKCEEISKELARRERILDASRRKYLEKRTPPDEMDPDNVDKNPLEDKQLMVATLRKRLEDELEQYQKHCRQVREKSFVNLKMHLPELCRAMSVFSLACTNMYKDLRSNAQSHTPIKSLP